MYLVHPDGEIVTDYSGRQDFGQKFTLADYYSIYQLMAVHDRDPLFAAMASLAGEAITHPGALPNNAMLNLLLHPALRESSVQPAELPTEYRKIINGDFNRSCTYPKWSKPVITVKSRTAAFTRNSAPRWLDTGAAKPVRPS